MTFYQPHADVLQMPWKYQVIQPGMDLPDLDDSPVICVDAETKPKPEFMSRKKAGLDHKRSELLGVCVGVPGYSWYVPMRHRAPGSEQWNVDPALACRWLRDTIKNKKLIVNQNLKFDAKILAENGGVDLLRDAPEAQLYDTMIASQLIDERWPTHALKPVCEAVLGIPAVEATMLKRFTMEAGQKKDLLDYSVVPADLMGKYGCKDAELPLRLMAWQASQLNSQDLMGPMKLEMETLRTMIKCELKGFRVDVPLLKLDNFKVSREALRLEEELHKQAGCSFNSNSAEELADVVATVFEVKVKKVYDKKKKVMKPKFDDLILQEYCLDYPHLAPFFFKVRMVRRLQHLQNSFIESYLTHNVGGIIYPNFMQLSQNAATRMTSFSPNVQQVSAPKEWEVPDTLALPDQSEFSRCYVNKKGRRCWEAPGARQYFIPREGHALLLFDQSQVEYRNFAHYSGSKRMIDAYRNDPTIDLHEWMRTEILEGRIERRPAKNVHFGIVYGMGPEKTVKTMQVSGAKITLEEGLNYLALYHARVPEVKDLKRVVEDTLKSRGYLRSILGGKSRLAPTWQRSKEDMEEEGAEHEGTLPYQGLNRICQRSSMDELKHTMNAADRTGYPLVTPIHDELIYEPRLEDAEDWARNLKPILQTFNKPDGTPYLKVPLYVEGKYAPIRWSEAEKITFE